MVTAVLSPEETYQELLPKLRTIARTKGYAIAVHGSMKRDLDAIAVPWIDDPATPKELWKACMEVSPYTPEEVLSKKKPLFTKHGIVKMLIPISREIYIDLAIVMPRVGKE